MSYHNGPRIVTNGLVLYLDAGNSKSYPGSGTAWNDLSGNNHNGTLINSPTYSSANKGGIIFDGVNDGVNLGDQSGLALNSNFSICCWIRPTSFGQGSLGRIIHRGTINTGGYAFYVDNLTVSNGITFQIGRSSNGTTISVPNVINLNSWMFFAATLNPTTASLYKNNTRILQQNTSPATSVATNFIVGNRDPAYDRTFSGAISIIMFYNNVLSDTQILQNYNNTKGRYNL